MNPIIDPNIFYWVSVFNGAKTMCILLAIVFFGCLVAAISWTIYQYSTAYRGEDEEAVLKHGTKMIAASAVLLVVFSAAAVFVPNRETMYQIIAAKLITPNNMEFAAQVGKDITTFIKDTIVEAINATK